MLPHFYLTRANGTNPNTERQINAWSINAFSLHWHLHETWAIHSQRVLEDFHLTSYDPSNKKEVKAPWKTHFPYSETAAAFLYLTFNQTACVGKERNQMHCFPSFPSLPLEGVPVPTHTKQLYTHWRAVIWTRSAGILPPLLFCFNNSVIIELGTRLFITGM